MEAIVACGFESRAAPPGEYSFTNTLIEVLDDWINKRTFSASCLHAEILFQLKLKETKKGREGRKLEWCTTPIHINYTADSKLPGIELCRRNIVPHPEPPPPSEIERPSTFTDVMDIDFDGSSPALSPLSSLTDSGEFQTPHVLIKIGLEPIQGPIDMKQCLRWLEGVPLLGKWAKIEGVYPSFSTLIVLSMPISVWNMLPDHPACTFIGYVTGPGFHPESAKAKGFSTEHLKANPSASKQFPEPELPSARWSHHGLVSSLTDDSGGRDPSEYKLQEIMPLPHSKSPKLTPKPKPERKRGIRNLLGIHKDLRDRIIEPKIDTPDLVLSTTLPTNLATQSLSDADDLNHLVICSRCRLYKTQCHRETPHSTCVSCKAVGNLNCEIVPEFK
jgi:hypothetical protein